MAQSVNDYLLDQAIHHAIDLTRYGNGVVRRMIAILNRADPELIAQIAAALERLPAESFTVARLEALLASVRQINATAYAKVMDALPGEVQGLAGYEAGYQFQLLGHAIPEPILVRVPLVKVTVEQVYAAAMSRPFAGNTLSGWAQSLPEGRMYQIKEAIRLGYVQGQTTDQIVRRIRGTRAAAYTDGVLERPRKTMVAVVRTALSHTAQTAREEVYKANDDIMKAVSWTSVLDSRTSEMCRIRDGLEYSASPPHKPIGHRVPWGAGPGRLHWQCRSTSTPVTKSWRELGIPMDDLPEASRASMDGQVPAGTTYADWFKRQSAARQDEIVGPMRGKLMRQGNLPFASLYSNRGDWLSLEELKARDAEAFKKAGL